MFPAHAGLNRRGIATPSARSCVPRTRGAEPWASLRKRTAKDFRGDGLLVIAVPEGYPAAYVHHVPAVANKQFELLIQRGARFRIEDIRDREYHLRLLP